MLSATLSEKTCICSVFGVDLYPYFSWVCSLALVWDEEGRLATANLHSLFQMFFSWSKTHLMCFFALYVAYWQKCCMASGYFHEFNRFDWKLFMVQCDVTGSLYSTSPIQNWSITVKTGNIFRCYWSISQHFKWILREIIFVAFFGV